MQDITLTYLCKSPVSYQLKELLCSVEGYLQSEFGASVQPKMTNLFLHYVLVTRTIPLVTVINRSDAHLASGFVPKWPNLWQNPLAFRYCVKFLMFRFNQGREFRENDWRVVAINSEAAFERVMLEVMW